MRDASVVKQETNIIESMNIITQEESKINDLFVIVKQGELSLR